MGNEDLPEGHRAIVLEISVTSGDGVEAGTTYHVRGHLGRRARDRRAHLNFHRMARSVTSRLKPATKIE